MLSVVSASTGLVGTPLRQTIAPGRHGAPVMESFDDLKALAPKLNPVVGYWNPLGLGEDVDAISPVFGDSTSARGFLRHSEIKHGRVAMAAFVGFIIQENGIHWPWASTGGPSPLTYADISAAGGPAAQWDALPTLGKLQIIGFVGLLELWGELNPDGASPHYMRGGKPGTYPSFAEFRKTFKHPPLDLFDPFGFTSKMTPERKEKGLLAEINNGRLAMLGIMGMVAASEVEGAVPALAGKIKHYDGEVMAPFSAGDTSLPFVADMLGYPHLPLSGIVP